MVTTEQRKIRGVAEMWVWDEQCCRDGARVMERCSGECVNGSEEVERQEMSLGRPAVWYTDSGKKTRQPSVYWS